MCPLGVPLSPVSSVVVPCAWVSPVPCPRGVPCVPCPPPVLFPCAVFSRSVPVACLVVVPCGTCLTLVSLCALSQSVVILLAGLPVSAPPSVAGGLPVVVPCASVVSPLCRVSVVSLLPRCPLAVSQWCPLCVSQWVSPVAVFSVVFPCAVSHSPGVLAACLRVVVLSVLIVVSCFAPVSLKLVGPSVPGVLVPRVSVVSSVPCLVVFTCAVSQFVSPVAVGVLCAVSQWCPPVPCRSGGPCAVFSSGGFSPVPCFSVVSPVPCSQVSPVSLCVSASGVPLLRSPVVFLLWPCLQWCPSGVPCLMVVLCAVSSWCPSDDVSVRVLCRVFSVACPLCRVCSAVSLCRVSVESSGAVSPVVSSVPCLSGVLCAVSPPVVSSVPCFSGVLCAMDLSVSSVRGLSAVSSVRVSVVSSVPCLSGVLCAVSQWCPLSVVSSSAPVAVRPLLPCLGVSLCRVFGSVPPVPLVSYCCVSPVRSSSVPFGSQYGCSSVPLLPVVSSSRGLR
uniref:Uncharacterized protein n=1 Tax=Knipowitschia caucasica TaxID=637954 RepID=A0AAV2KQW8_KNICA